MGNYKRIGFWWEWTSFTFGIAWMTIGEYPLELSINIGFLKMYIGFGKPKD